jgi:hypothetical protein
MFPAKYITAQINVSPPPPPYPPPRRLRQKINPVQYRMKHSQHNSLSPIFSFLDPQSTHTVEMPVSGVHFIMKVKSALPGEGGGGGVARPPPYTLSTIASEVVV